MTTSCERYSTVRARRQYHCPLSTPLFPAIALHSWTWGPALPTGNWIPSLIILLLIWLMEGHISSSGIQCHCPLVPLLGGELHCHSHPMGNCISPRVLCSFTMRFAYFAPWGNVFWIQEFKNITMPSTGIPPFPNPPLVWGPTRPLYGGYGGGKGASKPPC